jgi:D-beta-D-heptose 7-phosphate kinase/D-beta-D-heptose 1-phosphate adenosyltransferase
MALSMESKLIPFSSLGGLAEKLRAQNKKIVTTNGCFDILHFGHLKILEEARSLGDVFLCGVNSDRSVKKLKGERRPIFSEKTRALQVAALESVDYVTIFDEDTPERFLSIVKPAVHVKGGDYAPEDLPERACVESFGGKVVCLPYLQGFSTTRVLELLSEK